MKTKIEERQYNRFIVLYSLYKEVNASTEEACNLMHIASTKSIKNGIFKEVYDYLDQEKFIDGQTSEQVYITHLGKKIVEKTIIYPEERTEYFPAYKEMGFKD